MSDSGLHQKEPAGDIADIGIREQNTAFWRQAFRYQGGVLFQEGSIGGPNLREIFVDQNRRGQHEQQPDCAGHGAVQQASEQRRPCRALLLAAEQQQQVSAKITDAQSAQIGERQKTYSEALAELVKPGAE